jgi:hypothetical protein
MEENCIGSQNPQRTVVLEKKKNDVRHVITETGFNWLGMLPSGRLWY